MRTRTSRLIAIALIAAGAVGCSTALSSVSPRPPGSPSPAPASLVGTAPAPADPRLATIDGAEARWMAHRPSTYAFTYTHRGPGGVGWDWRYRVTVLDGRVQAQWMDGYAQSDADAARMSVDGLFDLLRRQLGGSGDLEVDFDPDLGYPTRVAYDDRAIADSDATETVTDFVTGTASVAADTRKILHAARVTWKRWEPTAYDYVWRTFGPTAGPTSGAAWDIHHADGRTSIVPDSASGGSSPAEAASVESTFDAVDAALDAGAWVDVTVAPTSGLPVLVAVDPTPSLGDEYWIRFTFRDTAREVASSDLRAAQDRWFAAGLQHFSYTWRYRGKYAPLTYAMTLDGEVATIRRSPGTPITEASGLATPRIDDTFRMIQEVLNEGGRVVATYDPVLGYPVRVEIDPFGSAGPPGTITIKAFEVH